MVPVEPTEIMLVNTVMDTTITRRVYTNYDKHDNWIQCTEMDEKGKIKRILKRRIAYREE